MERIFSRYIDDRLNGKCADYNAYILEVAEKRNIQPNTVKSTIGRYIKDGWQHGFSWEWENYIGWRQDFPPKPTAAIQMICESFPDFWEKHKEIILETRAYYWHTAIRKELEKEKQ